MAKQGIVLIKNMNHTTKKTVNDKKEMVKMP